MPYVRELVLGRLRMPWVIAGLILVIALFSIAAAVGGRNDAGWMAEWTVLWVPEVWRGQLWRLVTWAFFEFSPLNLIFACLTLYWFGNDLARRWGEARMMWFFLGMA